MSKILRFRMVGADKEHECKLCNTKHYGSFAAIIENATGKVLGYICVSCKWALGDLNLFNETSNMGGPPRQLSNPRGRPASKRAVL